MLGLGICIIIGSIIVFSGLNLIAENIEKTSKNIKNNSKK